MRHLSRSHDIRRIVLVTHYFPAHRGGVEIVAGELAKRLSAHGRFQIRWFASDTDASPDAQIGLEHISVSSTNVIERRWKLPYPLWSPAIIGALWRSIRVADVVHLHDFLYCGNLLSFCIAKAQSKPILLTQHVGFISYDSWIVRLLQRIATRMFGSLVLSNADCVIFVSETVRREFSHFVRFRREPALIWNGVDAVVYSPVEQRERERLRFDIGINEGRPAFLFVGRFVEKKGLAILHELARRFPNISWLFAGAGPLDPQYWGLENVTVFRQKQGRQLADLYRAADLLILPSKGEGFPLVVQEAMACGTPVLLGTETAASIPDLHACCFSESVAGPQALSKWQVAVQDLVGRMDQLEKMRSAVADFAHKHWSWDTCTTAYAELFDGLGPARVDRAIQSKV